MRYMREALHAGGDTFPPHAARTAFDVDGGAYRNSIFTTMQNISTLYVYMKM